MSWGRLDDTLHGHPKAIDAGLEAMGLWVLALSHCAAYLTDGHVRRAAALRIAGAADVLDRLAAALVRVGLWDLHSSGDGWQVHDFLAYNPSRVEVQAQRSELSEKRAEAGRRGAASRWQRDGKANGNGMAKANGNDGNCHRADHGPVPSRPVPIPSQIPIPSLNEESSAAPRDDSTESSSPSDVRRVFEHWTAKQAALTGAGTSALKLTEKRRGKIRARLHDGYTVAQLKQAIDGMFATPFNVEGHHTDVELACRDAQHVDRYMAGPPKTNGKAHPPVQPSAPNGERAYRIGREGGAT